MSMLKELDSILIHEWFNRSPFIVVESKTVSMIMMLYMELKEVCAYVGWIGQERFTLLVESPTRVKIFSGPTKIVYGWKSETYGYYENFTYGKYLRNREKILLTLEEETRLKVTLNELRPAGHREPITKADMFILTNNYTQLFWKNLAELGASQTPDGELVRRSYDNRKITRFGPIDGPVPNFRKWHASEPDYA